MTLNSTITGRGSTDRDVNDRLTGNSQVVKRRGSFIIQHTLDKNKRVQFSTDCKLDLSINPDSIDATYSLD